MENVVPLIEIVLPVYNEEQALEPSVRRLHAYLASFPFSTQITIADNASLDQTLLVAQRLTQELATVAVVHLEQKGRGRALRQVWLASRSPIVAYMDIDLSTDLRALLPLLAPLVSGHSALAIGRRLGRGARVTGRSRKRELLSRGYNALLQGVLGLRLSDAQCGFKAARLELVREILTQTRDVSWFFDTELLVRAQWAGLRIHEQAVDWTDDPDSRVDVSRTVRDDLRGIWRMLRTRRPVPAARSQLAPASEPLGTTRAPLH